MTVCAGCGAGNPEQARFCMACGSSLSPPTGLSEERKVVTTLFCDLVGFTAMSERADPEDVDAVLRRYHTAARRVIEMHGGTVEKFIGDAVVGVFGVPAVHEDDPERGMRAGLRLVQTLAGMTRPDGSPLEVRVGVNTGEALVRLDVTPGSGDGFVAGDAVNTAARLQAAAPPGGVVAGALTHALTRGAIIYSRLPTVMAKGKTEPVAVWRAEAPVSRTGLRTTGRSGTPMIGREAELHVLDEVFAGVCSTAKARSVLLVGEPGIGKSRLILEFARSLDERPTIVTWRLGRCAPYGEEASFLALAEIVKAHAGILDTDATPAVEAKLEGVLPDGQDRSWLRQRLRALLGLAAPEASRDENVAAWTLFLAGIAARRPTVLVFEDLHWADDAMLDFVRHLGAAEADVPLLVVATTRPELLRRRDDVLVPGARVARLTLAPLKPPDTESLVSALLDDGVATEVSTPVLRRAGGNPLYAEEYVRLLLDRDLLVRADGLLRLKEGAELPVPDTVQAVLAARLDTLPPEYKALICDAAVIGETFWAGGVAALSGRGAEVVGEALAALADLDFVRPVVGPSMQGEAEYLFWHALARDVAYGELPRGVRAHKHAAVARWIEQATGERTGEFAEILVHHYEAALELARVACDGELAESLVAPTVRCLARAGERALRLDAPSAERHLTRALELAGPDAAGRPQLLLRQAEALFLMNRFGEAKLALGEAIPRFCASGDRRSAAVAMCKLAHTLPRLGESSGDLTQAAVDLLAGDEPSPEQAEVLGMHALTLAIANADQHAVLDAAAGAVEVCRLLGLPDPALALHCQGDARLSLGDFGGIEDLKRAIAAARAQGLGVERARIEVNYAGPVFSLEGARAVYRTLAEGSEFARSHGLGAYIMSYRAALIACLRDLGEWDRALQEAVEILPALEKSGDAGCEHCVRAVVAQILAARGDASEAVPWLPRVEGEARKSEAGWLRTQVLIGTAAAHLQIGERAAALALLAECLATPAALPTSSEWIPAAVRCALTGGDAGLADRLAECYRSALPAHRLPLDENVVVSLAATLAEARREHEAAAAGFADAAARWRGFEMPYEEAQALFGQGRCLAALGRAREATAPLTAAREVFTRLGAKPSLAEADTLLGRITP